MKRQCEVKGCGNAHRARGMCKAHYQSWYWSQLRASAPGRIREYKKREMAAPGAKEKRKLRVERLKKERAEWFANYWKAYYWKNREKSLARSKEWKKTVMVLRRKSLHESYVKELVQPRTNRGGKRLAEIPAALISAHGRLVKAKRALKLAGVSIR
jgi:hypothetical protein